MQLLNCCISYSLRINVLLHCPQQRLQHVSFTFDEKKKSNSTTLILSDVVCQLEKLLHLLLTLAFSSSVRCSVLVRITTFTLLTLKT